MTDELSGLLDALLDSASRLRLEIPEVPGVVADRAERATKADKRVEGAENDRDREEHAKEAQAHRDQVAALKLSIAGHFKVLSDGVAALPGLLTAELGDHTPIAGG